MTALNLAALIAAFDLGMLAAALVQRRAARAYRTPRRRRADELAASNNVGGMT